jgi:mono/diheme cytochrome c family protein
MKALLVPLAAFVLTVGANSVFAADAGHGKQLQQKNCMSCHDDAMYTRENRKVTTPAGLKKQVRRCEQTLGLQWFDEDIDAVSSYLNDSFYKFK